MGIGNTVDKKNILNSWKEISQFLKYHVRTCYRWEKNLGLPIHRYDNDSSRSTVFAYKSELDKWLEERKQNENFIETKKPFLKTKVFTLSFILFIASLTVIFSVLYIKALKRSSSNTRKMISIGIQPFENVNSSEYDEYLAQGVTGEISSYLSTSENLRINTLAPTQEPMDENISQNHIKTDYILRGKIQKDENKIKLQYKLINAQNNKTILNNEIHEQLGNIQLVKYTICEQINEKLGIANDKLMAKPGTTPIKNHEAFDVFLKGKYILNHIKNNETDPWKLYHKGKYYYELSTLESNELAIELFCTAIDLDKYFDQAYVGLAQCYINNVNLGWDYNIKWLNKADYLLNKVSSTAPKCPEYYSSLAKLYLLKYIYFNEETKAEAFDAVKKGLENYPEHPDLNCISSYCHYLRYGEEGDINNFIKALECGEKSFWQRPFSINNLFYAELLLLDGQFDKALEICDFVKKVDSSLMTDFRIGEINYYSGDLEKSESIFNQIEASLELKIGALYYLGMIAAQNKNVEQVQNIIVQLENLSKELLEDDFRISSMCFGIDNEEEGFRHLDDFFGKRSTQKLKFNYKRYISLDRNFDNYYFIIGRKYFE